MKLTLLTVICVFSLGSNINGQNYFNDPEFDEPKALFNSKNEPCENRGLIFDEYSKAYFRIGNGSPDIIVPKKDKCKYFVGDPLIKSQCLGLAFSHIGFRSKRTYKEPVATKLNQHLRKGVTYEISFDILINPSFILRKPGITNYQTSHFNIILKNSLSGNTDTLTIPVPDITDEHWQRAKLVFDSSSDFNIVQFDFLSEDFFHSKKDISLYVCLDNFKMIKTSLNPTPQKQVETTRVKLSQPKVYSYYFDSDKEFISSSEQKRLINDIEQLSLYNVEKISVLAYTDNTNSIEYNKVLSVRRAQNILLLLKKMLKDVSIVYNSEGKGIDFQNFNTEARRVDIVVQYKNNQVVPWYQTSNNEQYSVNYTYLGNTSLGKIKGNIPQSKHFQDKSLNLDAESFDAIKMILVKARSSKILIINEAHNFPSHRVFISKMLSKLSELGYSKLAVEALQEDNKPHSLTFKDPVFYRYLLIAKSQGYDLISYDNKSNIEPSWEDIKEIEGVKYNEGYKNVARDMNIRDYNQFLSLEDEIDNLKENEKMLIHVGLGHGNQIQVGEWKPLGSYLTDKYGDEAILSVDQVTLNDCYNLDSNDYFTHYNPTKSIVCSTNKMPYGEKEFSPLSFTYEQVSDLQVLHPRIYSNLNIDTSYIYVKHNEIEKPFYPLAIIVYESDADPRTDVAYSAVEVKDEEDFKPSIIPNQGGYKVMIKDSQNKIVSYDSYSQ